MSSIQISGVIFLLVGLASFFLRHDYISLLSGPPYFPISTYLFIGIGGIIVLMGAVGCLGTLKEIKGCLLFVSGFFCVIRLSLQSVQMNVLSRLIYLKCLNYLNKALDHHAGFFTVVWNVSLTCVCLCVCVCVCVCSCLSSYVIFT